MILISLYNCPSEIAVFLWLDMPGAISTSHKLRSKNVILSFKLTFSLYFSVTVLISISSLNVPLMAENLIHSLQTNPLMCYSDQNPSKS